MIHGFCESPCCRHSAHTLLINTVRPLLCLTRSVFTIRRGFGPRCLQRTRSMARCDRLAVGMADRTGNSKILFFPYMPSDRWNVQLLPHGAAAALSLSVRLAASRALPKKPYRTVPASDGPRVSLCGWRRFLRKVFLDPACAGRRDVKYPMPVLLAGESFFSVQGHHLLQKYQYCHVQEETAFFA